MHLKYARDHAHCERPDAPGTDDIIAVTCPRCLHVIEVYRSSLNTAMRFGFNPMNDVTARNFRIAVIPQARIVANEAQKMLLDAMIVV